MRSLVPLASYWIRVCTPICFRLYCSFYLFTDLLMLGTLFQVCDNINPEGHQVINGLEITNLSDLLEQVSDETDAVRTV
jgi:hypothetical protein